MVTYLRLFILMLLVIGCGDDAPPPEPVIRPVRYVEVFASGSGQQRSFSGTSQAALQSTLSFKVLGTIEKVAVKVGDQVKSGQLIAEVDGQDYELQVQDAEAGLKSAQAQERNAVSNYSRVRALYESDNASKNDLDAARAGSESAQAQVRSVEKKLELAKLQRSYTRLTSPVNGAIAAVNVEENENVSPGQPVALLTAGDQIEVTVAIPEGLIAQIREGNRVSVTFDAIKDKTFAGTVREVGVTSVGMATTFPVTVRLDETDENSRPGMAAQVQFTFGSGDKQKQIFVPSVAVGEDRDGRFVFVVEPNDPGFGTARRRPVQIGGFNEAGLEIVDGLNDGDRVVTAGVSRIQDGQKVRLP